MSPCQSFTCVDTWEPDPALVAVANKLFFRAVSSNGGTPRLWVTDGTEQGTTRVKDKDGHIVRKPHGMAAVGSTLFLRGGSAQDPSLWKSDGTTAGTRMVSDVDPFRLTNVDGTLFFRSRYFDTYYEQWLESDVWKSDGTAAGTVRVKEVLRPGFLVAVGSELYFTSGPSYPDDTTIKLWKSDGSGVGTNPVADVDPQFTSLVAVGNRAYFTLEDSTLHRSDGTAVEAVTGGLYPGGVTDVAGKAFFTAYLPRSQSELWAVAGK